MRMFYLTLLNTTILLISCKEKSNVTPDCTCSASYSYFQNDSAFVFLPNIISPNGDNINDKFRLTGNEILDYTLIIKDGTDTIVILNTSNPNWDGQWNSGTAVTSCEMLSYELDVTFNDGTNMIFQNELLTFKNSNLCPSNISSCFFEDQFSLVGIILSNDPIINSCN